MWMMNRDVYQPAEALTKQSPRSIPLQPCAFNVDRACGGGTT